LNRVEALKHLQYPVYIHLKTLTLLNEGRKENLITAPITVAELIETPSIHSPSISIIPETQSEILIPTSHLLGSSQVEYYFQPKLIKGVDYEDLTHYPVKENLIRLRLKTGQTWRKFHTNALYVIGIDSGAGLLSLSPVSIAVFRNETSPEASKQHTVLRGSARRLIVESILPLGVEVLAMEEKVYQSYLRQRIEVYGFGLHEGMKLTLDPPLEYGVDYTIEFISDTQLNLNLLPDRRWRETPGPLLVKEIILYNRNRYLVNGKEGTVIATIMKDPDIATNIPTTVPTCLPTDLPTPPPTVVRADPDFTIQAFPQIVYDRSVKVRIRSTGFESIADSEISFGFTNQVSKTTTSESILQKGRDYEIVHDHENGGLLLKLIASQQLGETQHHRR
jgi:hypothetical protein